MRSSNKGYTEWNLAVSSASLSMLRQHTNDPNPTCALSTGAGEGLAESKKLRRRYTLEGALCSGRFSRRRHIMYVV